MPKWTPHERAEPTMPDRTERSPAAEPEPAQSPGAAINPPAPIADDHALVAVPQPQRESWLKRLLARAGLRSNGTFRADLAEALSDTTATSDFTPEERAMLNNILRLREVRVEDVMVPRGDVVAVDRGITLAELLACFEEEGHSRMPVYRESLDDPIGMVHVKDLMLHLAKLSRQPARQNAARKGAKAGPKPDMGRVKLDTTLASARIMRRVLFVPPSMLAIDLMGRMQATRTQMALVIDEYGGTDGLVSLEDIVEEVVGEIEDEHDDDVDELIVSTGPGLWRADARAEIGDVRAALGPGFDMGEMGEEVDTLGGLVFTLAGHIPVRGEVVTGVPGYEFRITDADPRRVRRVEIVSRARAGQRRRRNAAEANRAPTLAETRGDTTSPSSDAKAG